MYKHVQYDLSLCCPAAPAACCMMGVQSWSVWSGEQQLFGGLLCFSRGTHMWVWLAKLFWGHIKMNLSVQKLQLLSYMLYTTFTEQKSQCKMCTLSCTLKNTAKTHNCFFFYFHFFFLYFLFSLKIQCSIANQRKLFQVKCLAECFEFYKELQPFSAATVQKLSKSN